MKMAKSIFGSRDHEGYVGREQHARKLQFNYFEEDNDLPDLFDDLSVVDGLRPNPFSIFGTHITDVATRNSRQVGQPEFETGPNDQPVMSRFDEFGLRVEEEDGPEQSSKKLLGIPFVENAEQKKQCIAHLEFSHNKEACELTFENVDVVLPRTEKLRQMVRDEIPHSLRPQMVMILSCVLQKKLKTKTSYEEIFKASACLLLLVEEENAFWVMVTIVEDLLPASYYSSTLLGIQADQRMMQMLIANYLASVDETLKKHDIELSLITLQWLVTLFANVFHMKILVRSWAWFFYEGSIVLFHLQLGMLRIKTEDLQRLENSAQIFNSLRHSRRSS